MGLPSFYRPAALQAQGGRANAAAKPPTPNLALIKNEPELLTKTEAMFLVAVANSISIVTLPLLLRLTSGTRLIDMGISLENWPRQARVGILATLFVCPIVYLVQFQVLRIWPMKSDTEHPVQVMLLEQFTPGVTYLAALCAVVMAPLFEELFFRALFQGWLADRLSRLRRSSNQPESSASLQEPALASEEGAPGDGRSEPVVKFVTEPSFPEFAWPSKVAKRGESFSGAAVILTSIFFGLVHLPQWPAPISIFVLSLAFGAVYQRTGSLIASICMHATFNGISTLMLLVALVGGKVQDAKKQGGGAVEPARAAVATLRVEAGNAGAGGHGM